jgi:cell division protein FtsB
MNDTGEKAYYEQLQERIRRVKAEIAECKRSKAAVHPSARRELEELC